MNKVEFKTEDGYIVSFLMTTPTVVKDQSVPDYFKLYPVGHPEWLKSVMIGGKEYFDVADDPRAALPWKFAEGLRIGEYTIISENKDIRQGAIVVNMKGPFGGTILPYVATYYFAEDGSPFNIKKDKYSLFFNNNTKTWWAGNLDGNGKWWAVEMNPANVPEWTKSVSLTTGTRDPLLQAIMQWRMDNGGKEFV